MEIDLDELNRIHDWYKRGEAKPHITNGIRELILTGAVLHFSDLETSIIEWHMLSENLAPNLAKQINVATKGSPIPVLREVNGTKYFVYHPSTGDYVGEFEIIPEKKKE